MIVEWSQSLNLLRDYVIKLSESLRLSGVEEPLEKYKSILFTCLCAAYGKREFCKSISLNPSLEDPVKIGRNFIKVMNRLSEKGLIISGESILYSLQKTENILKTYKKKPFILLCDGLSLPEYVYLYDRFSKITRPDGLLYAINPGGMTKTYEYLTSIILGSVSESMTMTKVGELLMKRLGAMNFIVLRKIDEMVHKAQSKKFPKTFDMIVSLHKAVEEIATQINIWAENYCVLVISDHGYDIFIEGEKLYFFHKFTGDGPCLSLFSATLIIG
jgi:hypothetical protein